MKYHSCQFRRICRLGSKVHLALVLYSLNEPGKLLYWLCHDEGTVNIFLCYCYY